MAEPKSPTGTADTPNNSRGVRGLLTARLFGVPAWMVGLGIGGAVLIWQRMRPGTDASADVAADVDASSAAPGDAVAAGVPGAGATTPGTVIGGMWTPAPSLPYSPNDPATTPNGTTQYETNAQWRRAALEWALAEKASWSALDIDGAISLWFDGREMTEQQAAMINTILREFGTPPDSLPSPLIIRKPTTGPTPITKSTPGAPAAVRFGAITATTINVGWDPPASTGGTPITGYGVQIENVNTPGRFTTVNATQTGAALTVTGNGNRYRVRVQARNAQGSGAFSPWSAVVATPGATPPAAAPKPAADTVRSIRRGDVLWNMVRDVYGNASLPAVRQVAAHNGLQLVGSGSNVQPRPWNVGQTVKFPPKAQIRF